VGQVANRPCRRSRLLVEELERRALPSFTPLAPAETLFRSEAPGAQIRLRDNGDAVIVPHSTASGAAKQRPGALRLDFVGANSDIRAVGLQPGDGFNDFIASGGRAYDKVVYRNVYDGIDVLYRQTTDNRFEFDFLVRPGADLSDIRIGYRGGAKRINLDHAGRLHIRLPGTPLVEKVPFAFRHGVGANTVGIRTRFSDGFTGTETFSYLLSDEYSTYLAAVAQSNQAYVDAIAAAHAAGQAALDDAHAAAQAAADPLYDVYLADLIQGAAEYTAIKSGVEAAYQSALQAADGAWQPFYSDALAAYESALTAAQNDYDDAEVSAEQTYQAALAAADADHVAAIAPYQAAWDDAYAALQANPQDPEAQAAFDDAQAALDAAIADADAIRAAAYSSAQTAREAELAGALQAFGAAEDAANDALNSTMSPMMGPDDTWTTDEQAAWDAWLDGQANAETAWYISEQTAWTLYADDMATLNSNFTSTQGAIESQYYFSEVSSALSAWQDAEEDAWDAYVAAMYEGSEMPELEPRIENPEGGVPPLAPFQEIAFQERHPQQGQGPNPFGGALQLRGGQLVIPQQYPIERPNNRPLIQRMQDRLGSLRNTLTNTVILGRLNLAGVLTGDIFDPNVMEQFNNLQATENSVLITINGILTPPQGAQAILNSINTFNVGNRRVAVVNGTHGYGVGDIAQIVFNEDTSGQITTMPFSLIRIK